MEHQKKIQEAHEAQRHQQKEDKQTPITVTASPNPKSRQKVCFCFYYDVTRQEI